MPKQKTKFSGNDLRILAIILFIFSFMAAYYYVSQVFIPLAGVIIVVYMIAVLLLLRKANKTI